MFVIISLSLLQSCSKSIDKNDDCININSTWEGVYECQQGITNMTLEIKQSKCSLEAVFTFYENPINPGIPSGSYTMRGEIDSQGYFELAPESWIERPAGWEMLPVTGDYWEDKDALRCKICGDIVWLNRA